VNGNFLNSMNRDNDMGDVIVTVDSAKVTGFTARISTRTRDTLGMQTRNNYKFSKNKKNKKNKKT